MPLGSAVLDGETDAEAIETMLRTFDFEEKGHLHFDCFARVDGQLRVRADRRPGRIRGRREPEGELSFFLFGNAGPSSTELLRFWGVLLRLKLPAET